MAKAPQSPSALNEKQARFVEEYLIDLNATQAAIRAGYSAKTADQQGHALLKQPKIRRVISARQDDAAKDVGITQARVLRELALLSFSDVGHYEMDPVLGTLTITPDAPKGARRAISSIKRRTRIESDGTRVHEMEIKLWDKPGPLKLAGQHVGLFGDREEDVTPPVINVFTGMRPPPELEAAKAAENVGPTTTSTADVPEDGPR